MWQAQKGKGGGEKREREKGIQSPSLSSFLLNPLPFWRLHYITEGLNGLTDRRKTAKNLVDSRKNWKILTVSRK